MVYWYFLMGYHLGIEPFCTSRLGTHKHCQNVKVRKVEHVECLTADWIHKNRSVAWFKPCMMMITTPWFLMMSSSFIFQSWLILVSPGLHASPKAPFFGCFLCFWWETACYWPFFWSVLSILYRAIFIFHDITWLFDTWRGFFQWQWIRICLPYMSMFCCMYWIIYVIQHPRISTAII